MKTAYLIGIKGVGMTALAKYLVEDGYVVEGSDNSQSYVTDAVLAEKNIKVYDHFDEKNISSINPDVVIVSAAYDQTNPEVAEAEKRNLKIIYYSEALGMITADQKLIAVAGVHGKTTTTSLIALMLEQAKMSPSFIIGAGEVPILGTNARKGQGEYFVLEADEYRKSPTNFDSKFLDINPEIAIISSIELDHPDVFASEEDIYRAFYRFACRVPLSGEILINIDYQKSKKLVASLADRKFQTYGFSEDADWQVIDVREKDKTSFSIKHGGQIYGPYELEVPGKHNVLNATTAVIIAELLNINEQTLKETFAKFKGVQRRFQEIANINGVVIVDDYAHHPTAVKRTLEAAKAKYADSKIWCIFQPHTFSRTEKLLKDFGLAFDSADKVILTDIYASARELSGNVTIVDLLNEIKKSNEKVIYLHDWKKIKEYVFAFAKAPVVILTIGAGDVYKLGLELVDLYKNEA
ncbi:MAG: UDP-N-acetylmuramate--L-alanine ligase [Candidatus Berkelbacteria bacterium]